MKVIVALGVAFVVSASGSSAVYAQKDPGMELRASGQAGEQADGYMGVVGNAGADIHALVAKINLQRRAYYTDLAARRGAKVEEVAAMTACELFRTKVGENEYYRLPDGVWRRRGKAPVPLPDFCG
ncbi:MAG: uncharacterized protein QOH88_477 [Verrucomicrobiota bacterium]|jgi:uncharacterized protein YdbL (DUF1318 family)